MVDRKEPFFFVCVCFRCGFLCVCVCIDGQVDSDARKSFSQRLLSLLFFYFPLVGLVAFTLVAIAFSLKKEEEEEIKAHPAVQNGVAWAFFFF